MNSGRKRTLKMITYKMVENTEERYVWEYHPEGKEKFGLIFYDKKTGEYGLIKKAFEDQWEWDAYRGHMYNEIRRFIKSGEFKETGMVAWYQMGSDAMRIRFRRFGDNHYTYATVIGPVKFIYPKGTGYLIQIDGYDEDKLCGIRDTLCEVIEK